MKEWELPKKIDRPIEHNDIRIVNLPVTVLFEKTNKIVKDIEPYEYISGFIMEVLPNQKFVYNNHDSEFLGKSYQAKTNIMEDFSVRINYNGIDILLEGEYEKGEAAVPYDKNGEPGTEGTSPRVVIDKIYYDSIEVSELLESLFYQTNINIWESLENEVISKIISTWF